MQKAKILFIFVFIFSAVFTYAQEDKNKETLTHPAELDVIKVGVMNVVVPKGAKVIQDGNKIIVEGLDEYASRKFIELEERFREFKMRHEELEKKVEELEKALAELQPNEVPSRR